MDDTKRLVTVAVVAAAAAVGCAPVATAITGEEMCKAMHWALPLPPTVGWSLMPMTNDSILTCFDNGVAIASDGHDVQNDTVQSAFSWKVTSMSPPAGTMVMMDQKISLTVVHDPNAPT
jgi:hypothetical protein